MRKVHGGLLRLNKQVLVASKFAGVQRGSMLGTLHPYTIRKLEKVGEPYFHCKKTACHGLQQQTKVHA